MGRRKRTEKTPPFTAMVHQTVDTPAFRSLTPLAQCLYWRLRRRAGYNGNRNGEVFYSVREAAEDHRAHQDTIRKAFYLLQARGFIIPTQIGSLGVAGEGRATTWRVTELPTPQNPRPTKEFMAWKPGAHFPVQKGKSPCNQKHNPALNLRPACPNAQSEEARADAKSTEACPNPQSERAVNGPAPALIPRAPKESTTGGGAFRATPKPRRQRA